MASHGVWSCVDGVRSATTMRAAVASWLGSVASPRRRNSDEFASSTRFKAQDSSRSFGNRAVLGTASATSRRLFDGPRETWRRIVLLC